MAQPSREPVSSAALPEQRSPEALRDAAALVVKRAVADSTNPMHLASLAQVLRRELPQLANGWGGAATLAAFLQQLRIEPVQRAVLENGTTVVLFDPARHEAPAGVVGDRLIAGMLRAAELPEMKGSDLVRILKTAQPHMGNGGSFEIAEVSRGVAAATATAGSPISARRVAAVLQAMIFGGLDAAKTYPEPQDLVVASMGVILSAWARETQDQPDDEARNRLLTWLGLSSEHVNPG